MSTTKKQENGFETYIETSVTSIENLMGNLNIFYAGSIPWTSSVFILIPFVLYIIK
jgi:hypothetical protein